MTLHFGGSLFSWVFMFHSLTVKSSPPEKTRSGLTAL